MRKFIIGVAILLFSVAAQAQTPDALWSDLLAGNARYVAGSLDYRALNQLRNATAGSQWPPTAILSCADSRVPAELIFDRSVGELFVVRVAGNVEDPFGIASLEYAVSNGWTKLIVVMAHSDCGAVNASLKPPMPKEPEVDEPTPDLYKLILRIRKSFGDTNPGDLREATRRNLNYTAAQLALNPTLKTVPIVKAIYDVQTGKVERIP
jgi:carbonic anhydrase